MIDMHLSDTIRYVGVDDTDIDLFESQYPVPNGVSYNSYVILDEKVAVMDTVDKRRTGEWLEKLEAALAGRKPDYLVIQHLEPDHAGSIGALAERYPDMELVASAKAVQMLPKFYPACPNPTRAVKEGDTLALGRHSLTFVMAPMVHWPEVMVSYESAEKVLFSADGFGTFGAIAKDRPWIEEAGRYYFNIVGKYGAQVQALLKKAAGLDIQMICPLHGPVWRKDLGYILDKYAKWAAYEPEVQGVLIAFASVYGGTETAANILACRLAELGVPVEMYDVSVTHYSYVLSDAFKYSHIVFASTTYNNGIFVSMENLLHDIAHHALKNRKVALIQNGSWAPASGKLMSEILCGMKDMEILEAPVTLKSTLAPGQDQELEALAKVLAASVKGEAAEPEAEAPAPAKPRGFVCKICGFVYESDTLPEDFTCPICRRPASDFEPLT